ncbi:hypothetical protein Hdeb2414_s0025g00661631 [Helianthus debilis subsp. tardiflorus]
MVIAAAYCADILDPALMRSGETVMHMMGKAIFKISVSVWAVNLRDYFQWRSISTKNKVPK